LILTTSPWIFSVNYQGISYGGVKAVRNESFIFGAVDSLNTELGLPKKDFETLLEQWK
jgi:hypothetical protein